MTVFGVPGALVAICGMTVMLVTNHSTQCQSTELRPFFIFVVLSTAAAYSKARGPQFPELLQRNFICQDFKTDGYDSPQYKIKQNNFLLIICSQKVDKLLISNMSFVS